VPRGVIFVAGVLSSTCEVNPGGGVLMEWSLGEKPACRNVQVAHTTPIVSMVYGPYDNGPVITADGLGVFKVWEMILDSKLRLSQQIELLSLHQGKIAMCVEQPRSLYVALSGKRLVLWQRSGEQ